MITSAGLRSETSDDRKARQRAEVADYEKANDIVPGTAGHDGRTATGGVPWEDYARMALARRPEDRTERDLDAIRRYPNPRSGLRPGATFRAVDESTDAAGER